MVRTGRGEQKIREFRALLGEWLAGMRLQYKSQSGFAARPGMQLRGVLGCVAVAGSPGSGSFGESAGAGPAGGDLDLLTGGEEDALASEASRMLMFLKKKDKKKKEKKGTGDNSHHAGRIWAEIERSAVAAASPAKVDTGLARASCLNPWTTLTLLEASEEGARRREDMDDRNDKSIRSKNINTRPVCSTYSI